MILGLHHVQIAIPPGGEEAARRFYGHLCLRGEGPGGAGRAPDAARPSRALGRGGPRRAAVLHVGSLRQPAGVHGPGVRLSGRRAREIRPRGGEGTRPWATGSLVPRFLICLIYIIQIIKGTRSEGPRVVLRTRHRPPRHRPSAHRILRPQIPLAPSPRRDLHPLPIVRRHQPPRIPPCPIATIASRNHCSCSPQGNYRRIFGSFLYRLIGIEVSL